MILQFTNVSCPNNWAGAWLKTEAAPHLSISLSDPSLRTSVGFSLQRGKSIPVTREWLAETDTSLITPNPPAGSFFFRWICCWQWMTEISKKPHARQWKCPSSALKVWAHLGAPGRKLPSKPIFNGATSLILHCSTKLKVQLWNINCFWVRSYTQW